MYVAHLMIVSNHIYEYMFVLRAHVYMCIQFFVFHFLEVLA